MSGKKIVHITPSYKPTKAYGGPTISIASLCEALVRNGTMPLSVITTTADGANDYHYSNGFTQEIAGVTVQYYKRWAGDHIHLSPALLWRVCKFSKKDTVLHIHSWWNLVSMLTILIARVKGIPLVISPRGTFSSYSIKSSGLRKWVLAFYEKAILPKAVFHVTSAKEHRETAAIFPSNRIITIPNIISFPALQADQGMSNDTCRLIFVGRLHPVKNLPLLLQAIALLPFRITLEIIGDGEEAYVTELKRLCNELSITGQITWCGNISDRRQLYDRMLKADVLCLVSETENFANVVIESLAVGTAVLVSDQVALADYVEENDFGWVCKAEIQEIADTIGSIYHSPEKTAAVRKKAPAAVRAAYDEKQLAGEYLTVYQSLTIL